MKICKNCNEPFPKRIQIDGKEHNLQQRKFCLMCSPFKSHNTKDLSKSKTRGPSKTYKYVKKFRHNKKYKCIEYLGGCCSICGYNKCPDALHLHHKDPSIKGYTVSHKISWGFERIKAELDKCVLLCANCHTEEHYKSRRDNEPTEL